jgi:hypothetical protein
MLSSLAREHQKQQQIKRLHLGEEQFLNFINHFFKL